MEQQTTIPISFDSQTDTETMSSRQIAELTQKNHGDVVRDIKVMCKQMEWGISKFADTYTHPQNGQQYTEYQLPRFECEVLVTGYDVNRRAAVIQRWYDLESGKAQPLIQPPIQQQHQPDRHQLLEMNMDVSLKAMTFVKAYGIEGNQAMLAADRLVKSQIDFSPLESMGQNTLIAPIKAPLFSVTELGKLSTPVYSAINMNLKLQDAGMQLRTGQHWTPTKKGKPFCEMLDVGKHHGDGTPIKQLKWYQSVLDQLTDPKPEPVTMPGPESKPVKSEVSKVKSTPPAQEGITIADPDKPLRASPKKKTTRKKHTREGYTRELYDLGTHLSFRELAEMLGRQRCFVVETLEKMRIVKWLEGRRKWMLTEKGWNYGAMYDPTSKEIHIQPGQRTVASNARPVFKLSVIDLF